MKHLKKVKQPKDYYCELIKYSQNVYSQNGEDGVLREVVRRLGIGEGLACEFGAWDGKHLSNTYNLVVEQDWKCLMIEGDPAKYIVLEQTAEDNKNIFPMQSYVHYLEGKGTKLDILLKQADFPSDFDLLSIDIDSCDYHVWKSLENFKPKIVVIEHSGKDEEIIQREGAVHKRDIDGSTAFPPMLRLGEEKGYTLLCDTGNMIFLRNDLVEKIENGER